MAQFNSIRFQPSRPLLREVTADRLNTILAEIKRNRPIGERGITVRQSGESTYIGLAQNFKPNVRYAKPWDIYVVDSEVVEDVTQSYTLKVSPGTISNILPANWDAQFTANDTDLHYGIATISTDGQAITGIQINISAAAPTQQTPQKFGIEESVEYLFGLFYRGGSYNLLQESIYLIPQLRLVTSADPAAQPGESPFDLWYELARQ